MRTSPNAAPSGTTTGESSAQLLALVSVAWACDTKAVAQTHQHAANAVRRRGGVLAGRKLDGERAYSSRGIRVRSIAPSPNQTFQKLQITRDRSVSKAPWTGGKGSHRREISGLHRCCTTVGEAPASVAFDYKSPPLYFARQAVAILTNQKRIQSFRGSGLRSRT